MHRELVEAQPCSNLVADTSWSFGSYEEALGKEIQGVRDLMLEILAELDYPVEVMLVRFDGNTEQEI